jgi:aminoglycoside 6'-N-acetyltransferase I
MIDVRPAIGADRAALVRMRCALWPGGTEEEHAGDVDDYLAGTPRSATPLVVLVAVDGAEIVGFVEADLRSHADGCDARKPTGYLEGWFVAPSHRRRGVGAALVAAAEDWARRQGCEEMASDTWSDPRGAGSEQAHLALGYAIVDRVVNFRKRL